MAQTTAIRVHIWFRPGLSLSFPMATVYQRWLADCAYTSTYMRADDELIWELGTREGTRNPGPGNPSF